MGNIASNWGQWVGIRNSYVKEQSIILYKGKHKLNLYDNINLNKHYMHILVYASNILI